jgi:alkanesulfonate monooxygenase SsuD/methylene tetrahydromethanopterin reductase-like flavin-dependent oxidoreductase (luciferase family)
MDLSMGLPTFIPHGRSDELSWYRKIDEGPWDGLAICDRLVYNSWALTVQLAAAAAVTERVKLWTAVATLPTRNAAHFAKEIATVDQLSEGRLTLGVGIGGQGEDYAATGTDPSFRRRQMDEHVAAMRDVWSQKPPVDGYGPVGPTPYRGNAVPLVAGVSGPKALARAAQWASGVNDPNQTIQLDGQQLSDQKKVVVQAWADAGRDEAPHFSACMWFALGPDPEAQFTQHLGDFFESYGADVTAGYSDVSPNFGDKGLLNAVNDAREAGVDDLILIPTTSDPSEIDRAREVLGI